MLKRFRAPVTPYGPGHRGVDLGGSAGDPVMAAGDGTVLFAGPVGGCDLVSVEHPGGLRTTYEPITPTVKVGQEVLRGQVIGNLLAPRIGCPEELTGLPSTSAGLPVFLYWGVHRDAEYLDPLRLVETDVRLLPWSGQEG